MPGIWTTSTESVSTYGQPQPVVGEYYLTPITGTVMDVGPRRRHTVAIGEFVKSTTVENDRLPSGGTSEDRIADLASRGTVDEMFSFVMSAFPCEDDAQPALDCRVPAPARPTPATSTSSSPRTTSSSRATSSSHRNG